MESSSSPKDKKIKFNNKAHHIQVKIWLSEWYDTQMNIHKFLLYIFFCFFTLHILCHVCLAVETWVQCSVERLELCCTRNPTITLLLVYSGFISLRSRGRMVGSKWEMVKIAVIRYVVVKSEPLEWEPTHWHKPYSIVYWRGISK